MAIPVARVHLAMAHAALPPLLPTPPTAVWKNKMLPPPPLLPTPAAILPNSKPLATKPSHARADSDETWDAHKTNKSPASSTDSSSASSLSPRSAATVRSSAGRRSSRKNATSPPPPRKKPGRADSAARWDAHKKAAIVPATSSSSSSSSSLVSSTKMPIGQATSSTERWDVRKKRCQALAAEMLDDGDRSSTGSNDDIDDMDEEEEIVWKPKPRAMYAGPGFAVVAAPEPRMFPMPTTSFMVRVA